MVSLSRRTALYTVAAAVTRLFVGHEEGQAQPAEARLDDESVVVELRLDLGVAPVGHREQRNAVRPRTRAARPGLNPEEIVEQPADVVVVKVPGYNIEACTERGRGGTAIVRQISAL